MTHKAIWENMTPEQQELLRRKCQKQIFFDSEMMRIAIASSLGGKFTPMDLFDGDMKSNDSLNENTSKKQRRINKYGKWGWSDKQIAEFTLARGHNLLLMFEKEELEELGIEFNEATHGKSFE